MSNITSNLQWRRLVYPRIPDHKNHFSISNYGDVRNDLTGTIYKPEMLSSGYLSVRPTLGSRCDKCHIIIHRAVAYTYIPNPSGYPVVNHLDGDKTNNCVSNLEWCTYTNNAVHMYQMGLFNKQKTTGENNHNSKLKSQQVNEIRERYQPGSRTNGCRALAKEFGVSHTTIRSIVRNEVWH